MIEFQHTKALRNLTRLTLPLVAAVLLTNVSQAVEANLSDMFAHVNPAVVEIRTLNSSSLPPNLARALPSGVRLTIEIWRQGQRETIEFVPAPEFPKLEQSHSGR